MLVSQVESILGRSNLPGRMELSVVALRQSTEGHGKPCLTVSRPPLKYVCPLAAFILLWG